MVIGADLLRITTCILCIPMLAQAQPAAQPSLHVDLLPAVQSVLPGEPVDVALRFKIQEGWHIYWKNSGDSGQPPKVKWNLPPGFTVSPLQYPVPERSLAPGGLICNVL